MLQSKYVSTEDGKFMPYVIFYYIICYVFSEANTTVLESFTNSTQKCLCLSFFVFKNSHYDYIPMYMHKTLPTFGNEKEQ